MEEQQKKVHTPSDVLYTHYPGLPSRASVLIFEFVAEKQDSLDVKSFFLWSLPIFGGKTELCGGENLFIWSSAILRGRERIHKLSKGVSQKVWETLHKIMGSHLAK